ncbi:unnamed protein product [Pocillopora meandrina]|uniref:Translocation protein SEC62 n=1 Tax=Pocillopora meandrina TaxID=46732 RepID=A0AAU9VT11_9CNID|nr:unnamed protein product [Pocillopora meandrina]
MGDQHKFLKKRKKKEARDDSKEPSKEENEIGKYLKWNCPSKPSTMMGEKVEYFIGSKAIDCLMDSKWASGKGGTEILFTDRESVELYLDKLLILGFFNRVIRIKKVKKTKEEKEKEKEKEKAEKEKEKENDKGGTKEKDESEGKKSKKKPKKENSEEGKKASLFCKATEGNGDGEGKKKRKVKVKLELHEDQIFVDDDDEAYVWRFDPLHPRTFILGILVVIGTIAICLFPLWPSNIREYVWYLSVLASIAVGSILVLALLRYVFFAIVWVLTAGKHHFWLLPNLTEECGFFESFVPLYTHEYKGNKPEEKQPENETEKDNEENKEEKEDEGDAAQDKKGESSEEKEKEPWVTLTEEEVATARSEVDKDLEDLNDPSVSEVKC